MRSVCCLQIGNWGLAPKRFTDNSRGHPSSGGRVPLVVVDKHDHSAIEALLSKPFGIAGKRYGLRRFYTIE